MAYVEPRGLSHDALDRVLRNGARSLAVVTYSVAVVVAIMILSPVLFSGGEGTVQLPNGPTPVAYKTQPGQNAAVIAAQHGLGLTHYYLLNPELRTLGDGPGKPVVVGWR